MNKSALIVFQKNAIPGKVKTRLANSIGEHQALQIYQWLTSKTHQMLSELEVDKFIFYSDFIPSDSGEGLKNCHSEVQSGANLGDRMSRAFEVMFAKGFDQVVIIGTDCPELSSTEIKEAFSLLNSSPIVFGPAKDGGYYLLGSNRFIPELFQDIPWSTDVVLELSMQKAHSLNLDFKLLKILSDIDTLADWEQFKSRNHITP